MGIDVSTYLTISCRDSALLAEIHKWLCDSININLKNSERNKNEFRKYPYIDEIFKDIMADSGIGEYKFMKLDDFIKYNLGLYKYKKDWEEN